MPVGCRMDPGRQHRNSLSPLRGTSNGGLPDLRSPAQRLGGSGNPQALRHLLNGDGGGGGGGGMRRQGYGGSPYMPSGAYYQAECLDTSTGFVNTLWLICMSWSAKNFSDCHSFQICFPL